MNISVYRYVYGYLYKNMELLLEKQWTIRTMKLNCLEITGKFLKMKARNLVTGLHYQNTNFIRKYCLFVC